MASVAIEVNGYTVSISADDLNRYVLAGLAADGVTLEGGAPLFWPDGDTDADAWSWTVTNPEGSFTFGPATLWLTVQDGEVPA